MSKDLDRQFLEALDGMWNNSSYGGFSDPPRKDFSPQSDQRGYSFPYQKNAPPVFPPIPPGPENPSTPYWPMETISYDLADSFTYLTAAANKMENCLQLNQSLKKKDREKLDALVNYAAKILGAIQNLDAKINFFMGLEGDARPINPFQEVDPSTILTRTTKNQNNLEVPSKQ